MLSPNGPDRDTLSMPTVPPDLPVAPAPPAPPSDQELPPAPHAPRRQRWIVLGIVLAVLVLVVPLALYLAVRGDQTPGSPQAASPPAATPAASAAPQPSGQSTPNPSTGRIPKAELFNSTFDIPAWPADAVLQAPTRQLAFHNGRTTRLADGRITTIEKVAYTDVNRDGRDETLAAISLTIQGGTWQVAAFTRSATGAIVPFAQVLATTGAGPIKIVGDVAAGSGGTVRVMVGDDQPCCGITPDMVQYQWRTYSYDGAAFHQSGGPTAFGRDLRFPDLAVDPAQLTLGAPSDGVRHGGFNFTIRNRGTVAANGMIVSFRLGDATLTPEGSGWAGFTQDREGGWTATMPAPRPGQSVLLSLGVSRPASGDSIHTGVFANVLPLDADGNQTKDAWLTDNAITIPITLSS